MSASTGCGHSLMRRGRAASYSTASSARASSVGDTSRASAFAVLRLIIAFGVSADYKARRPIDNLARS